MPPAPINGHLANTVNAKANPSYFPVRGDSVSGVDDREVEGTRYIITAINGNNGSREANTRRCYLAMLFTEPTPGCGIETSVCTMVMLHRTEMKIKGSKKGKQKEVNRPTEVYIVSGLDEGLDRRIVCGKGKGKGKGKEALEYGDEGGNREWPTIDENFINQARIDFLREFGDSQPMYLHENQGHPYEMNVMGIRPGPGPSELGPGVGTVEFPQSTFRVESGSRSTNAGQSVDLVERRHEFYGVNGTTGKSVSLTFPPSLPSRSRSAFVPRLHAPTFFRNPK